MKKDALVHTAQTNHLGSPWCELTLTVPFHDLDPMQIVWHGNYFKYFDQARFALFRKHGIELYDLHRDQGLLLPVTRTQTKYIQTLGHGDAFTCRATLVECQIKVVIDFLITRSKDGQRCTIGRSEQVALQMPENELLLEIPEIIRNAFGC